MILIVWHVRVITLSDWRHVDRRQVLILLSLRRLVLKVLNRGFRQITREAKQLKEALLITGLQTLWLQLLILLLVLVKVSTRLICSLVILVVTGSPILRKLRISLSIVFLVLGRV